MIGVGSALISLFLALVCYSLTLTAKRADENLLMICEQNQKIEEEKGKQEMESKRDILRVIEKEIKKGSAPVAFAGLGFSEECYHLVDSQAKMNQLLDYFFRNEEYAALADRQVKSNIYAEMGKRLNFRSARSDRDRKNMEVAAKRWIKKKHPTFDGDVYVENIRCFLDISREELEKRKCTVNEQDITALIFSQKHDVYGGRLPIHVRCLLDEFANIGQIPKFEKLIATIRSREISASIILQSKSQLKAIYKDNADTIEGNCDTTLFLGGKEKTTLKEIAEILGKETIDLYNTSDTRGSQRSYGMNYQKTGKELMSQDEIAVMDGGKCILQVRGVRPFFSNKYDICKHKNYKYLSDYDKKNTFDIEKYLSTNLILKPEDEVELYQM